MLRIYFLIFTIFLLLSKAAFALDIVYPANKETTINAKSTFFIGNVHPLSELTINSENVKIWKEGVFVHVVPLKYGINYINLKENINGKIQTQTYKILRPKPQSTNSSAVNFTAKKEGIYIYTKTNNDNSTVRSYPSTTSRRITELQKGTVLYISGKQGNYYKIEENGNSEFWIHKNNLEELKEANKRINAEIIKSERYSDKFYKYTKISVSHPVLYTFEQIGNNKLKLTLYGTKIANDTENSTNNTEFIFEEKQIAGYDGYYENGNFIVRIAKVPDKISMKKPLQGIRIFIDAGHGGDEKGSVGPTRIPEKDINLAISKRLIELLKQEGAIVSYSRLEDKKVKLYDRVKIARDNNAQISLSIHANALPDGADPYKTHGTETHYYQDNAELLALIIKKNLSVDLNLRDNGIHRSSFAMTRSTNPISVLVEIAYMINPDEYQKLKDKNFQGEAAKSIKKSLEEFIFLLKN